MRKKCLVCGAPLLDEPLFVCRNMPAKSQDLATAENLEQDKPVNFNLCQCTGCGLVQFDCNPVPYYLDSTRAGERSDVLIQLRRKQYKSFIETYNLQGKKIIEIGAGKGGFLRTLKEMTEYNIKEFGIEHNKEFVQIAKIKNGVNVSYGNPESPNWVLDGAPFDAFMSFAYPARLINPNAMLAGVSNNLVPGGYGLVMVASLEHLLEKGGYYDITADHIAYYSKDTFRFLFEKNGFEVLELDEIAGLYIYAVVHKRKPYDLKSAWSNVDKLAVQVEDFIDEEVSNNRKVGAWCAGHYAFTVLASLKCKNAVRYIIDNAEFKQGKYAPASHIKIVGTDHYKEEPVDTVMILGPMYVDELVQEIKEKLNPSIKIVAVGKDGMRIIQQGGKIES